MSGRSVGIGKDRFTPAELLTMIDTTSGDSDEYLVSTVQVSFESDLGVDNSLPKELAEAIATGLFEGSFEPVPLEGDSPCWLRQPNVQEAATSVDAVVKPNKRNRKQRYLSARTKRFAANLETMANLEDKFPENGVFASGVYPPSSPFAGKTAREVVETEKLKYIGGVIQELRTEFPLDLTPETKANVSVIYRKARAIMIRHGLCTTRIYQYLPIIRTMFFVPTMVDVEVVDLRQSSALLWRDDLMESTRYQSWWQLLPFMELFIRERPLFVRDA